MCAPACSCSKNITCGKIFFFHTVLIFIPSRLSCKICTFPDICTSSPGLHHSHPTHLPPPPPPPPPTPQAGRVTDSDGGGCERSSTTLSNGQFIQKHRGDNSNVADVTRIHYAPSPKALNFTARLLLRRVTSLRAFSYGA